MKIETFRYLNLGLFLLSFTGKCAKWVFDLEWSVQNCWPPL